MERTNATQQRLQFLHVRTTQIRAIDIILVGERCLPELLIERQSRASMRNVQECDFQLSRKRRIARCVVSRDGDIPIRSCSDSSLVTVIVVVAVRVDLK